MSASARPSAFPTNWTSRIAWIGLAFYAVYATSILELTWARFVTGLDNGGKFLARMFPPNMQADKLDNTQAVILKDNEGTLSLEVAALP